MADANITNNTTLPPEVLVKIFRHCDLDEIVNIVDVCQLWRDVVIHQHMSANDIVVRRRDDIYKLISLLRKPVSFIKLHIVWQMERDMDCSSCSSDDDYSGLEIYNFVSHGRLAYATSLTRLQSFTFKVEQAVTDCMYDCQILGTLLDLLLQTSTNTLTHFKLVNTGCIFPAGMEVVELLQACRQLKHLVLNRCCVDEEFQESCMDTIPALAHLELLDLRESPEDTPETYPNHLLFIEAVKKGCPNISDNILMHELRVSPSDDLSLLQFVSAINMLSFEGLDTDQLTSIISCLNERVNQLTVDKLDVDECDHLTDDILLSLVKRLRGLKKVVASECHRLTNEGVVNVIASSPELDEINISGIKNIDKGIIQPLDRLLAKQIVVHIEAQGTKLSDQMKNNPGGLLFTGKNRNIYLRYRP